MKMTAEEILKIYKSDPTKETMKQLALDNECTIADIGLFLKEAADKQKAEADKTETAKRKPGRPPKAEKLLKPKELPEPVRATLESRIAVLDQNKQILLTSLEKVENEARVLRGFLYE